jgi:hypothetical protein
MRGRFLSIASFLTILAMALAPACGGATDPHDLLAGAGGDGTSSGGVDAGHDTGSHVGPGPDSGSAPDTGMAVDSSTGPMDSGFTLPEAGPQPDAGGDGFSCPPTTCKEPRVCCATGTGQGSTPTFVCQDASKACGNTTSPGTPISCAVAADCNGDVCCGDNLNGFYSRVACAATCAGTTTGGATEITFCDPAGDDCPAGTTCQASQVLEGYNVCN